MPGSNQDGNVREHNGLRDGTSGDMAVKASGQVQSGTTSSTSIIDPVHQDSEPSAAENLKMLIRDCGVSPHKVPELLHELPPQRFSDALIDFYFSSMYVLASMKHGVSTLTYPFQIEIGFDTLFQRAISVQPMLPFALTALRSIQMTSDFSLFCSLSLQFR
jgi:hypothetical protein